MALASWLVAALVAAATTPVQAYFLMGANNPLTTERIDPIVNGGDIAGHVHTVFGGSNFRLSTNTSYLRQSECSSVPIVEDKSNYWVPTMYFHRKDGSFTSVNGGAVIYYLFDDKAGVTTAFPDDFRMLSGDPLLRSYDAKSYAQQAITFLCLDFGGVTTRHNELPRGKKCPSGIRAQVNFPMCWDGKNTDSADHKSHVAFPSGGPDSGKCEDPKYPVTLPRVFMEMYWGTPDFKDLWNEAMDPEQPFVFSNGDPTGYGYHGDFINGWDKGVLQKAVDTCHCDPNGSLDCCAQQGVFTLNKERHCRITKAIDETTIGTLPKLPGNNPVQTATDGGRANFVPDDSRPQLLSPIYVYYGDEPDKVGTPVAGSGGQTNGESGTGSGSNGQTTTTQATSATTPTQSTSQGSEGSSSTESSVPPASPTGTQGSGSESGSNPPTSPPVSSGSNNSSSSNNNGGGSASQGSGQQGGYPPTSPPVSSGSNNSDGNTSEQGNTNPPTSPPVSSGSTNNNSGGASQGSGQQGAANPPANPPVSSGSGSSDQHQGGYESGQGSGQNSGSGSGTEAHTGGNGDNSNSNSSHSNSGSGSSGGAKTCGRKYRKRGTTTTTTGTKKRSAGFHRRRHSSGFEFNQF